MKKQKNLNLMKSAGLCLVALLCSASVQAQYLRTSYFMEGTHYRQQLNPALMPTKGYLNLPVLGGFNASVYSSSISSNDVMDILDDKGDFYTNPKFLNRLEDQNKLNVDLNTNILSAGWYKGKNFWAFNIGLRADIGATLSKDLFEHLNEMETLRDQWRTLNMNINRQDIEAEVYTELGIGLAREVNSRLSVGGRVKVLLGMGHLQLKVNKIEGLSSLPTAAEMAQWTDESYWQGKTAADIEAFKTKLNSYYARLAVDAQVESHFKGLEMEEEPGKDYVTDFKLDNKNMGISGYGLGIDLGASYKLTKQLTLSASVLDLGFLSWQKSAYQQAAVKTQVLDVKGSTYATMIDPNDKESVKAAVSQFQNDMYDYENSVTGGDVLNNDMLRLKKQEGTEDSRRTKLASTVVLGAEYALCGGKLALGALSTTRFVQPSTLSELTLSANYRPKSWFNLAVSYSAIQSAGKSFGLGMKLGPIFVGTDYMVLGSDSRSVNGFVGISFPLGGKKKTAAL